MQSSTLKNSSSGILHSSIPNGPSIPAGSPYLIRHFGDIRGPAASHTVDGSEIWLYNQLREVGSWNPHHFRGFYTYISGVLVGDGISEANRQ